MEARPSIATADVAQVGAESMTRPTGEGHYSNTRLFYPHEGLGDGAGPEEGWSPRSPNGGEGGDRSHERCPQRLWKDSFLFPCLGKNTHVCHITVGGRFAKQMIRVEVEEGQWESREQGSLPLPRTRSRRGLSNTDQPLLHLQRVHNAVNVP